MRTELNALRAGAKANGNVRQLWWFANAAGAPLDVALALTPDATLELALPQQLAAIVGREVRLSVITPGSDADVRTRPEGVLVWAAPEEL